MKLITFNDSKNITYFGECKLLFMKTKAEKCVKLLKLDEGPGETLTLLLDQIYIRKNNFLCYLDQKSNNSIVCVCSTKESCEKVFNAIAEYKLRRPQPSGAVDEEEIFKSSIFIPLIKQVQAGIDGHEDLKNIILDFVFSLDSDEQLAYSKILAEITLVPSDFLNYNPCKRSFKNISGNGCAKPEDARTQKVKASFYNEPSPRNFSDDVIYDIVEYLQREKLEKRILVFTSAERIQCFEFLYRFTTHSFKCVRCPARLKSSLQESGSKTFDFYTGNHVCEPINYLSSNYQSSTIIKSPNYKFAQRKRNGNIRPLLIIFDSNNKNLCYKFIYDALFKYFFCSNCKVKNGLLITARFIHHDGSNAIELGHSQHRCKPKKYVP